MRTVLILAALLAATLVSAAEPQQITVWKLDAGYYVVSGSQIVAFPPGGPVVPPVVPPTPDPTPDALTARSKAIKAAAEKATSDPDMVTTAWKVGTAYREIAKKIAVGQITGQEVMALWVKTTTDMLIQGNAATTAWKPMRDVFSEQWAAMMNKGAQDGEYALLLAECAAGLESVGPKPKQSELAMSRGDVVEAAAAVVEALESLPQAMSWAEILKIVLAIIEMLSTLF